MVKNRLGIIPARSGSKGIRDKNIRFLNGKPLIYYSITAALESKCFTEVMVSTDSREYADIAESYGAKVPFLRSEETASDMADKWEMVREVIDRYNEHGARYDDVCILQPTSPLRNAEDIRNAFKIFDDKDALSVVSVCECDHPPQWSGRISESGMMADFDKKEMFLPRQLLDKYYRLNGAIFISSVDIIFEDRKIYREKCYAYIMDRFCSIDIDNELDFKIAEMLMTEGEKDEKRKYERTYERKIWW